MKLTLVKNCNAPGLESRTTLALMLPVLQVLHARRLPLGLLPRVRVRVRVRVAVRVRVRAAA